MKGLHIILLAEGKDIIKHMRLSHRITLILLIIGLISFAGSSLFVKDYLKTKRKLARAEKVISQPKEEASPEQKERLLVLAARLKEITEGMSRITEVEEIALAMMKGGRPNHENSEPTSGIGGSDSNPVDLDMILQVSQDELLKRIKSSLDEMEEKVARLERSKKEFRKFLEAQSIRLASIPSIWPVQGQISSPYGKRESPFSESREFHRGVDIRAAYGLPVKVSADGVVRSIGYHPDYGRYIEVDHKNGFITKYAHLSKVLVRESTRVQRGQQIGLVGTTGNSTGPHLHYEVIYKGAPVNPKPYLGGSISLLLSNK